MEQIRTALQYLQASVLYPRSAEEVHCIFSSTNEMASSLQWTILEKRIYTATSTKFYLAFKSKLDNEILI